MKMYALLLGLTFNAYAVDTVSGLLETQTNGFRILGVETDRPECQTVASVRADRSCLIQGHEFDVYPYIKLNGGSALGQVTRYEHLMDANQGKLVILSGVFKVTADGHEEFKANDLRVISE